MTTRWALNHKVLYTIPKWRQEYKKKRLDNRALYLPIECNVTTLSLSHSALLQTPCEKPEK